MKIVHQEEVFKYRGRPVFVQEIEEAGPYRWAVQFAGNGHYFATTLELMVYLQEHFHHRGPLIFYHYDDGKNKL